MSELIGDLEGIGTSSSCSERPGVRRIFLANRNLIDWEAMRISATNFDPATFTVLDYIYLTGGEHVELQLEKSSGQFDATYSDESKEYEILLQAIFKGKEASRTHAIRKIVDCCDLTAHLYMSDGTQRVIGPEYDFRDDVFDVPTKKLAVSRHLDSAGVKGGDDPRDELDFSNTVDFAPLYANVDLATIRASAGGASVTTAYGPTGGGTDGYGPADGGSEVFGPEGGSVDGSASTTARKPKAKTTKS